MSDLEVEPAAVEPAAGEPEAPAEPEWSGVSQEEWQEAQEVLQYLAQAVPPPQPPQQQQESQAPALPDWIDDDDRAKIDAYFDHKMAPVSQFTEQQKLAHGGEVAKDIVADIVARDGDFLLEDSKAKVIERAELLLPQMNQQYGANSAAAEHALEQAAKDIREWEEQVGKAYHDRQINQLTTLGGARQEPGAAGTGAQQFVIQGGGDEMDVVARYTHGTTL